MEKESVIAALGALAHESRLDVFRYLMQQGADGAPAGELAARLGLPGATLSFHLSALRHARLVRNRRDGRSIIYTADFEAMNAVLAYLTENCCQGRPEDCAIPQCDTVARPPENAPRRSAVRQRLKP
ncbi:MAG: helix-turn-helix transcriptional regulator [Gammaproteobacteria bacterium]|nr:helix-turn-helix transcriptional regulator [Gammaproteobacteria bacterium]